MDDVAYGCGREKGMKSFLPGRTPRRFELLTRSTIVVVAVSKRSMDFRQTISTVNDSIDELDGALSSNS
jgi:hypothetical protein